MPIIQLAHMTASVYFRSLSLLLSLFLSLTVAEVNTTYPFNCQHETNTKINCNSAVCQLESFPFLPLSPSPSSLPDGTAHLPHRCRPASQIPPPAGMFPTPGRWPDDRRVCGERVNQLLSSLTSAAAPSTHLSLRSSAFFLR